MDWLTVLASAVLAGGGAYLGSYVKEHGKLRAIQENLDRINRPLAEIAESAKLRWSKRGDVFAALYGRMVDAVATLGDYCLPKHEQSSRVWSEVVAKYNTFSGYANESSLFVPDEIDKKVLDIRNALRDTIAGLIRRAEKAVESQEDDPESELVKSEFVKRIDSNGDLYRLLDEVKAAMRHELDERPRAERSAQRKDGDAWSGS